MPLSLSSLPDQLRSAVALGLVALSAGTVVVVIAVRNSPEAVSAPIRTELGGLLNPSPSALAQISVDVEGKVQHPGLVTLPAGSRVSDALRAAGGAQLGVSFAGLNLARKLVDGEQIVVGAPAAPAPPSGATGGADPATGSAQVVNLNTATLSQLDTLPGVGPVMAQRIVDWRTAHGSFASVDQLREIEGIGDKTFQRLKDLVTV